MIRKEIFIILIKNKSIKFIHKILNFGEMNVELNAVRYITVTVLKQNTGLK